MVGKVIEGVGAIVGGQASKAAGKYSREVQRVNAANALRDGVAQISRIRSAGRQHTGRQLAAQAASGFQIGTGSAMEDLLESQVNIELDVLETRRQSEMRAMGYRAQGALDYAAGQNAAIAGYFGAAKAAADAVADYASAGAGGGGG